MIGCGFSRLRPVSERKKRGPPPGHGGAPRIDPAPVVAALLLPGATVGGVARSTGHSRSTVRRIRDAADIPPAPPVRPR